MRKEKKFVLGGTILKKGKFQSTYIVSLAQLKKNIFIEKSPFNFVWRRKKNLTLVFCFLLLLKREIKNV